MASRLSEHHPSFLEVVGDFTDTYFRVLFHSFSLSSTAVVFLSRSGCGWLLMSPVVSKLLISPSPWFLIDFFFASKLLAFLSKSAPSSSSWFVCHHRMQDSECRSNGYNYYDTFLAFTIWIINATGHCWSLRKTCEATVPILMLTYDREMKL